MMVVVVWGLWNCSWIAKTYGCIWSNSGTCACATGGPFSNRSKKCWPPFFRQASKKPAPNPPPQPPLGPTMSSIPTVLRLKALSAPEANPAVNPTLHSTHFAHGATPSKSHIKPCALLAWRKPSEPTVGSNWCCACCLLAPCGNSMAAHCDVKEAASASLKSPSMSSIQSQYHTHGVLAPALVTKCSGLSLKLQCISDGASTP